MKKDPQSELSILQETLRTALAERDALKVENAELRADREQFQHICETQRVAIVRLKKLCGENARGSDGFGSTDTTMKEPTR